MRIFLFSFLCCLSSLAFAQKGNNSQESPYFLYSFQVRQASPGQDISLLEKEISAIPSVISCKVKTKHGKGVIEMLVAIKEEKMKGEKDQQTGCLDIKKRIGEMGFIYEGVNRLK